MTNSALFICVRNVQLSVQKGIEKLFILWNFKLLGVATVTVVMYSIFSPKKVVSNPYSFLSRKYKYVLHNLSHIEDMNTFMVISVLERAWQLQLYFTVWKRTDILVKACHVWNNMKTSKWWQNCGWTVHCCVHQHSWGSSLESLCMN